jgi:hypothetical protein
LGSISARPIQAGAERRGFANPAILLGWGNAGKPEEMLAKKTQTDSPRSDYVAIKKASGPASGFLGKFKCCGYELFPT